MDLSALALGSSFLGLVVAIIITVGGHMSLREAKATVQHLVQPDEHPYELVVRVGDQTYRIHPRSTGEDDVRVVQEALTAVLSEKARQQPPLRMNA